MTDIPRRRKSFAAATANASEPLEFDLTLTNALGETREVVFQLSGVAPANAIREIAGMTRVVQTPQGPKEVMDASVIFSFFDRALLGDGPERFRALLDDSDWILEMDTLGEIHEWAMGEWGQRPTTPSSPSPAG